MEKILHKISKLTLGVIIAILLVWLLPWVYDFLTYTPQRAPFTLYSPVVKEFVYTTLDRKKGLSRHDESGNSYTEKEFDEILPLFFVRQLVADSRFPGEVGNVAVIPKDAQLYNFVFRSIPSSLDKPEIELYYLLESESGRVNFQMPTDVFRIGVTGIDFIDANTNRIKEDKSKRFTDELLNKGFTFPASLIVGDPDTGKDYDEGYLITDSKGALFQLKMVKGEPYILKIDLPVGLHIKNVYITEFPGRKTLGFISDKENKLYALMAGSYEIKQVDIPSFDPQKEVITIFGNLLDWTIQITSSEKETYYAINAEDLSLIRTFAHEPEEAPFFERWRSTFMPVRLHFTSQYDKWVTPRINRD